GEKWRMNNALNVSYNGDQSDEEDRTDVFAQDNPAHEPDSTVHQLRNSISNGWNYNLRNDLTWDLSERLKVRGGLNLNHAFSLQDLRVRRFDGTTFVEDPDLSNYQRTNSLSVPVTVNAEYTLPGGIYFSPGMELSNNFLNGKLNPGTPSISRFDALW